MAQPVRTLAEARRKVGRDKLRFLVFCEFMENGGAWPENKIMIRRNA